jgi:hypothetical protein
VTVVVPTDGERWAGSSSTPVESGVAAFDFGCPDKGDDALAVRFAASGQFRDGVAIAAIAAIEQRAVAGAGQKRGAQTEILGGLILGSMDCWLSGADGHLVTRGITHKY